MRIGAPVLAGLLAAAAVAGCAGGASGGVAGASASARLPASVVDAGSQPYRTNQPALTSDLLLPSSAPTGRLPLVVLVPGGGWTSADPGGLLPLATALAADGAAVATTTYRTASDQAYFPIPVEDVVCAVNDAAARVRQSGAVPGPVVVVGHSAGAQLAAVAALVGDRYQGDCPSPWVRPDGLVGLSGPYDVAVAADIAQSLFSQPPSVDPADWEAANPVLLADQRPDLPVVLVHGGSDEVVPLLFSQNFADALRDGGHEVRLLVLSGLGHQDVYQAGAATGPIEQLLAELAGSAPSATG